jgi:hypothetical protein
MPKVLHFLPLQSPLNPSYRCLNTSAFYLDLKRVKIWQEYFHAYATRQDLEQKRVTIKPPVIGLRMNYDAVHNMSNIFSQVDVCPCV